MSLLVWLPLHGNLNNYGLSPAIFTLTNASSSISVASTGKTANKCYQRTVKETASYIKSNIDFTLDGDISMCCWAKVTDYGTTNSANGIITQHGHNTGGLGITMRYISASDYRMSINTGLYGDAGGGTNDRTYMTYYGGTNIYNAWHHLCVTYNKSTKQIRMYVDGKLETIQNYGEYLTLDNNITPRPFCLFAWSTDHLSSSNYRPPCQLNDVRLYDHCLSPKEVKEISKGLVAHYPLRDNNNTAQVMDCSGYNNNGTWLGTHSMSTDISNGRNNQSVVFNGSTTAAVCGRGPMVTDQITVNIWAYKNDWSTATTAERFISCTETGGWNFEQNNRFICYVNAAYQNAISSTAWTALTAGWHMFTGVWDGYQAHIYIDGVLKGSSTKLSAKYPITYNTTNGIFIGAEAGSNATNPASGYYSGNLSDTRIYCTALSATDILELYQTSATVDNYQNLFAYELIEGDKNSIYKSGVVNFASISSNPNTYEMETKCLDDGSMWARIHYLNVASTATYFANAAEVAECTNATNRYSRMGIVDNYRSTLIPITNKLPDTSSANFSVGADSSTHAKYGNTSLMITGSTAAEVTSPSRASFSLDPTHKYYGRVEVYQETVNGSVDIYWPIAEPRLVGANPTRTANKWYMVSGVNTRSTFTAGNYPLRLDYNCSGSSGYMWFDGAMLIDLTEAFGAGNEPTAAWCDANIPYFTGTQLVDCSTHIPNRYEFMLTYPSLSTTLYNRWIQTSSPNATTVTGYTPITIAWAAHSAGIRKNGSSSVYNCDSGSTWYAPIGQFAAWTATDPIPAADSSPQSSTELWVRIDNIVPNADKCQIYNKSIVANNFYEI